MEGIMPSVVANEEPEILQADFLETRFDLTPAQARLVVLLFAGTSLRSCAKALGIKYETARSYLKSVFQKTGTHRQAELVLTVFQAMSDPNGGAEESRPFEKVADARLATVTS
jgi:DNA-binding CsgD family transcriptional regulator